MYLSPDIVIRENKEIKGETTRVEDVLYAKHDVKSTKTTIPFLKTTISIMPMRLNGQVKKHRNMVGFYLF